MVSDVSAQEQPRSAVLSQLCMIVYAFFLVTAHVLSQVRYSCINSRMYKHHDDGITLTESGARDYHVRLWDLVTGQQTTFSKVNLNVVTDIKWVHNEPLIVQTSEDLQVGRVACQDNYHNLSSLTSRALPVNSQIL